MSIVSENPFQISTDRTLRNAVVDGHLQTMNSNCVVGLSLVLYRGNGECWLFWKFNETG